MKAPHPYFLVLVFALLIAASFFAFATFSREGDSKPDSLVYLAGRSVHVTLADTEAEREQGLGGRESLSSDEGMLFVFPQEGEYGFWMKDMHIPIDIVWISRQGTVVFLAQNVTPDTYPHVFTPNRDAQYVLELRAGWTEEYNVRVGDTVRL
ncbi:DUF192 domain-containing protein [Candidatus Kaiserbacteria bacterium]|nr:DUF192 domain-containing protein [Candidatus Kaiserbacteria bacterium]